MTDDQRRPVAFPMAAEETDETERPPRRQPRALTGAEFAEIRPAEIDVFDVEEIADMFKEYDEDGNGEISRTEFAKLMESTGAFDEV